jgi:hypothetical protein
MKGKVSDKTDRKQKEERTIRKVNVGKYEGKREG